MVIVTECVLDVTLRLLCSLCTVLSPDEVAARESGELF